MNEKQQERDPDSAFTYIRAAAIGESEVAKARIFHPHIVALHASDNTGN